MIRNSFLAAAALAGATVAFTHFPGLAADAVVNAPAPKLVEPVSGRREVAVFGGGCFWGVEGVYSHVKGVVATSSGYAGGSRGDATYDSVSTGTTGHAESVRVVFDPAQVNYADLLRIYFSVVADPTLLNRQGPDSGPQYRSALFPTSEAQRQVAQAYIDQLGAAHVYGRPIVTRIEMGKSFFPAEGYHQDFYRRNPTYPYIVVNDRPKVEALRRLFPQSWRA
jgi:peptide-methionine (S)-S-oxide reductase